MNPEYMLTFTNAFSAFVMICSFEPCDEKCQYILIFISKKKKILPIERRNMISREAHVLNSSCIGIRMFFLKRRKHNVLSC